jgi:hypothetical protein
MRRRRPAAPPGKHETSAHADVNYVGRCLHPRRPPPPPLLFARRSAASLSIDADCSREQCSKWVEKKWRYAFNPIPLPSLPSPPLPIPIPPHPFSLPAAKRLPYIQLGGLGERCELPSGSGRSPAAKRILVHFAVKEDKSGVVFTGTGDFVLCTL